MKTTLILILALASAAFASSPIPQTKPFDGNQTKQDKQEAPILPCFLWKTLPVCNTGGSGH